MSWGKEIFKVKGQFNALAIIQSRLSRGCDINAQYADGGGTLLTLAIKYGDLDIVNFLIDRGADYNLAEQGGITPLHIAAKRGRVSIIERLIELGVNVRSLDNNHCTALHYAAAKGRLQAVMSLVEKGADVDASDLEGYTPLLLAIRHFKERDAFAFDNQMFNYVNSRPYVPSNFKVIQLLIHYGANVNHTTVRMWTPLHYATAMDLHQVVEVLLYKGANVDPRTSDGTTPLGLAFSEIHKDALAEVLISAGADLKLLHCASPLHEACKHGWPEVVELILERGGNLQSRDERGRTPFYLACEYNNMAVIKYLLKIGDDCNAIDLRGNTPLSIVVAYWPSVRDIKILIENGAYVTQSDYEGMLKEPSVKEGILKNEKLCIQAILNKFHNLELPELYKISYLKNLLPQMEKMKILEKSQAMLTIQESVKNQIQTNGHCNVVDVHLCPLNVMSVKCLVKYFE